MKKKNVLYSYCYYLHCIKMLWNIKKNIVDYKLIELVNTLEIEYIPQYRALDLFLINFLKLINAALESR